MLNILIFIQVITDNNRLLSLLFFRSGFDIDGNSEFSTREYYDKLEINIRIMVIGIVFNIGALLISLRSNTRVHTRCVCYMHACISARENYSSCRVSVYKFLRSRRQSFADVFVTVIPRTALTTS